MRDGPLGAGRNARTKLDALGTGLFVLRVDFYNLIFRPPVQVLHHANLRGLRGLIAHLDDVAAASSRSPVAARSAALQTLSFGRDIVFEHNRWRAALRAAAHPAAASSRSPGAARSAALQPLPFGRGIVFEHNRWRAALRAAAHP